MRIRIFLPHFTPTPLPESFQGSHAVTRLGKINGKSLRNKTCRELLAVRCSQPRKHSPKFLSWELGKRSSPGVLPRFAERVAEGGTTKNINTMSVFLALAYVYEKTRDPTYLPWLDSWAEWAMYDLPRTNYGGFQHITYVGENKDELWDDTLMMTVMPLAKIGKLLDRPHYIEEAKRQCLIHIQYLFDTKTGLFFHGWKFDAEGSGRLGHNFADARWARGNSWCTMVIPDFIELLDLEPTDPIRVHLCNSLQAQCEALQRYQSPSGAWSTLIDHPDSYLEASATAGFAYGIMKAVCRRYLDPQYRHMGEKAALSVFKDVDESGELQNTSYGTPMGHDLQFYKDIPLTSMPYGQAMAIMALGEYLWSYL